MHIPDWSQHARNRQYCCFSAGIRRLLGDPGGLWKSDWNSPKYDKLRKSTFGVMPGVMRGPKGPPESMFRCFCRFRRTAKMQSARVLQCFCELPPNITKSNLFFGQTDSDKKGCNNAVFRYFFEMVFIVEIKTNSVFFDIVFDTTIPWQNHANMCFLRFLTFVHSVFMVCF